METRISLTPKMIAGGWGSGVGCDWVESILTLKLPSGVQILKSDGLPEGCRYFYLLITAEGETSTSYYGQEPSAL